MIDVYQHRGNSIRLVLQQDGQPVDEGAVTRAIFRFGDYCLDTNGDGSDFINLVENGTKVELFLGLVPGLAVGTYSGFLTIYDADSPDGLACGEKVRVKVQEWKTCET